MAVKLWLELAFQDLRCDEGEEMELGADEAEVTCVVFHRVMGSRGSSGSRRG